MNTNDFLTRLRAGETPDAIAADLAAALNEAEAAFKAEEEAAKEAEATAAKRNDALDAIIDSINAYITAYEPDLAGALFPENRDTARTIVADAFVKTGKFVHLLESYLPKEGTDIFDIDSILKLFI